jgi:hypothetical protein
VTEPVSSVNWYERVAPIYDAAMLRDWFYRNARQTAVAELAPGPGDTCFVFFCGTGFDLLLLSNQLQGRGHIVGLDGSSAMLRRAQDRARRLSTELMKFSFVRADFDKPDGVTDVVRRIESSRPTCLLFSLGLTCLLNWRKFFLNTFGAAAANTRIAILDVNGQGTHSGTAMLNWTAGADITQPVWSELQSHASSYRRHVFQPFKLIDAIVFVAYGEKTQ